jgi:glycosyltransferase involved in cell wall biosynthesis
MRILVAQRRVPEPDTNAGDHRVWELMRMMRRAQHSVMLLANECRAQRYVDELHHEGIQCAIVADEVVQKVGWMEAFAGGEGFNCAVLQTYQTYNAYDLHLRRAVPDCALILDTVDLHSLRLEREAALTGGESSRQLVERVRIEEWEAIRYADSIWVVTELEKKLVEQWGGNGVKVIPLIHSPLKTVPGFTSRSGVIFLGGYDHGPNRDAVTYFMNEVYGLVKKSLPSIHFTLAGSNPTAEIRAFKGGGVVVPGFVPDHRELLLSHRIAIAPLRYGAGMKGKIGEYLSCGIPCITTSIGAEGMGLTPGREIAIADTPQAFADAMIKYYTDETCWQELSRHGVLSMARFSPDIIEPKVISALNSAVRRHHYKKSVWWKLQNRLKTLVRGRR